MFIFLETLKNLNTKLEKKLELQNDDKINIGERFWFNGLKKQCERFWLSKVNCLYRTSTPGFIFSLALYDETLMGTLKIK